MSDEKEDPRMDMGRNSEHYSDPTPGTSPPEETASPPTGAREERTMQNEQP